MVADPYHFGVGRRLNQKNWNALRAVGYSANSRLCDAQASVAAPAPDVVTFEKVTRPSTTEDGHYTPGLRFGDPRVMAVLQAICRFGYVLAGFSNRELREVVSGFLGREYRATQAGYDLRRLIRKGVIERIDGTHRYRLTAFGWEIAVFFTKVYGRILTPGLALLDPQLPSDVAQRCPLAFTWRNFERAFTDFARQEMLAA